VGRRVSLTNHACAASGTRRKVASALWWSFATSNGQLESLAGPPKSDCTAHTGSDIGLRGADVAALRNEPGRFQLLQTHVLLAMHTMLPPVRNDLLPFLEQVQMNRTTRSTAMNRADGEHGGSSRSHAALILTLTQLDDSGDNS
jgi:hypothetical protein